jgi:hypothetical protein
MIRPILENTRKTFLIVSLLMNATEAVQTMKAVGALSWSILALLFNWD